MIYNSTKRIICIHKGSACCGLSCKDFEFTAAMKRKSKQCFNLEENLKLYSNGKKILCRYFFKTQGRFRELTQAKEESKRCCTS